MLLVSLDRTLKASITTTGMKFEIVPWLCFLHAVSNIPPVVQPSQIVGHKHTCRFPISGHQKNMAHWHMCAAIVSLEYKSQMLYLTTVWEVRSSEVHWMETWSLMCHLTPEAQVSQVLATLPKFLHIINGPLAPGVRGTYLAAQEWQDLATISQIVSGCRICCMWSTNVYGLCDWFPVPKYHPNEGKSG